MDRLPAAVRMAGGVTLLVSIGVVLGGVFLTVHLSPTDDALYRAAVGTDLWRWGWIGIPASIVAMKTRRRIALGVAGAACAAAVSSVLIAVAAIELNPRPGLERSAAAFEPAGDWEPFEDRYSGYIFPRLAVDWRLPVARTAACDAVEARMEAWSEVATTRAEYEQGCAVRGRRDGHLGAANVGWHGVEPTTSELTLIVTRDV